LNPVPARRTWKLLPAIAAAAVLAAPAFLGCAIAPFLRAQQRPAFAVASIKPAARRLGTEGGNRSRISYTPESLTMLNISVSECVQWAYNVGLRDLLARRFQLVLRREPKMRPVYELTVAKGGPKLPPPKDAAALPSDHANESLPLVRGDGFLFLNVSMADFAAKLSLLQGMDLPVIDRTGIPGTFDILLKSAAAAAKDADTPLLFSLVRDQLGLRLAAAKAPLEMLVIDHFEKPSAN